MNSESSNSPISEINESQDEEKTEEKLTPQIISCPAFQRQIRDVVFTLIPEVPKLRDLYLSWESLSTQDKAVIDEYGKSRGNSPGMELYKPLVDALKYWDDVQNTQGAPGCDAGLVTLSGHPQIEAALTSVVCTLECLVKRLHSETSTHLPSMSDSRLTTSLVSVFEDEKDRGDSSLVVVYESRHKRSLSLDDIPNTLDKTSLLSL
ncbi:uncharacterized protein LOC128995292 [Macrosteles quadrilineatus]|uniref:uncharacterized protein LOC128995292 n=1 Tax=Macrosteles quadrilineatus TaxID=74068 RepID=UPI0023E2BA80|nr:uncharacterized protein LOC128995292 [Macrosteles quadrilineatus]